MTPKHAFEVLLNIPEPRRTLTLSDAATALRVSELLALIWMDLDFRELVMYVRRAYVCEVQGAEVEDIESSGSHPPESRKRFRMMVARDGVEPPTPAFSGLRSTT